MTEYKPTPLLAPWGARSGFYRVWTERSACQALEAIEASETTRLDPFRESITRVRSLLAEHAFTAKPTKEHDKVRLLALCRSTLPDLMLPWLDAAYALSNSWRSFPPLLGTGANEGSHGYSSTFMQMLVHLGLHRNMSTQASQDTLLRHALLAEPTGGLVPAPAGQHDPGRASGANQGHGIEQKETPVNPWNIVLAFEGMLRWACAATRTLQTSRSAHAKDSGSDAGLNSPFTVQARAVGHSSSAQQDRADARAELWTPLW